MKASLTDLQAVFPNFARDYLTENGFDVIMQLKGKADEQASKVLSKVSLPNMLKCFAKLIPHEELREILTKSHKNVDWRLYVIVIVLSLFSQMSLMLFFISDLSNVLNVSLVS